MNTPDAGKIIIPSRDHVRQLGPTDRMNNVHDMPSSILSNRPRMTAGSARKAPAVIDLARATHLCGLL
jgi:hypothetical protein